MMNPWETTATYWVTRVAGGRKEGQLGAFDKLASSISQREHFTAGHPALMNNKPFQLNYFLCSSRPQAALKSNLSHVSIPRRELGSCPNFSDVLALLIRLAQFIRGLVEWRRQHHRLRMMTSINISISTSKDAERKEKTKIACRRTMGKTNRLFYNETRRQSATLLLYLPQQSRYDSDLC